MPENNKIIKKANELYENAYSKIEPIFSNRYFTASLCIIIIIYLLFDSLRSHSSIEQFYLSILGFVVSLICIFLMFKFNRFFPFLSLGAILVLTSFLWQRFDLIIDYNIFYYLGFAVISASIVFALIKQNNKFVWIAFFLLFVTTLIPLITPQILIGDERVLLSTLTKLESGEFKPSDFGEHNYVNVSFVYFYYLVIIAKILGTSVANIFFVLKFFFLILIFLSFYLISTRFIDQKLSIFVILIAFFPIQNLHLAPQMIGKYIIFLLFIYFYLKYFKQLNSRIILVVMMLLITYINLTTLYISLAVFGFFVLVFFLKKTISKKAYFTDLGIFFLFVILVGTYSSSIDLFGLAGGFSDITGSLEDTGINAVVKEEDLSSKVDPFDQKADLGSEGQLVEEKTFIEIPFVRRFVPFINDYVQAYGIERLVSKLVNYLVLALLVIACFFLYPDKRQIFVLSLAIFFLVLFLIHIQFPDGVHATLELTSLVFAVCFVLIFHKKPFYFIPLMLLFFSTWSGPLLFDISQQGEADHLFIEEFSSRNIVGDKLITVTSKKALGSNEFNTGSGFIVSCIDQRPYDFYLNGVYLRCDDFGRIGAIGKKIYENPHSKAYLVYPNELI